MEHVNLTTIEKYLDYELSQTEQEEIEEHLDSCDNCFQLYLELLEDWNVTATLSDSFTDETVIKIVQQNASIQKDVSSNLSRNKTIVHYFLAAGLTILLMTSGIFQGFFDLTDSSSFEKQKSVTDQLMEKTGTIFNLIKGDQNS